MRYGESLIVEFVGGCRVHRCPPDVKQEYYFYYLDLKEELFGMKD